MKVAIVTIYDFFNHGNRLQNFALEHTLKSLGHEVTSLLITPKKIYVFFAFLMKIVPFISVVRRMNNSRQNTKAISDYKIIDLCSKKKLRKLNEKFDAFILGSDQMFNPAYMAKDYVTFLQFVDENKRIAYAPSFGISELNKNDVPRFIKGLEKFSSLSVRENEGKKIISNILNTDVPVVLDPTMLVSKDIWLNEYSIKVNNKPSEYIVTYFLTISKENKKMVEEIAKKLNVQVININSPLDKYFKVNPLEFLDLLAGAKLVCTNSFHGHALSIILEKNFISFSSFAKTQSRVKTLLSNMHLENRHYKTLKEDEYFTTDFTHARKTIGENKEQSLIYLKDALLKVRS